MNVRVDCRPKNVMYFFLSDVQFILGLFFVNRKHVPEETLFLFFENSPLKSVGRRILSALHISHRNS